VKLELSPIRRREAWLIAGIAALYLSLWISLPKPFFWGIDNGVKYQGMLAFSQTGRIEVPLAGTPFGLNPSYRAVPPPFSTTDEDHQLPVFSVLFIVLGGILLKLFGAVGPFVLPLVGGLGLLAACWLLWVRQRGQHDGRVYLAIVGVGTPFLFYSLELWEHTLAAAFVTLTFALLSQRREGRDRATHHGGVYLAGVALAVGAAMRTEVLAILVTLLIFWKFTNRSTNSGIRFFSGFFTMALLVFGVNYWQTGVIVPLHIITNLQMSSNASIFVFGLTRMQNFYAAIIEGFSPNLWSVVGVVPLVLLMIWRGWRNEDGWWPYAVGSLIVVEFLYLGLAIVSPNRIDYSSWSGGLLWVTPFAAMGLMPLNGERRKFWKLIWLVSVVFVLFASALIPTLKGIHWGPRMILVVVPLIVLVATARAQRWWEHYPKCRAVIVTLVVISIINQGYSFSLLATQRNSNAALNTWVASQPPQVVVTPLWWLAGDCAVESYKRPWLSLFGDATVSTVVDSLAAHSVASFGFLEMPPFVPTEIWNRMGLRQSNVQSFDYLDKQIRWTRIDITLDSPAPASGG